MTPLDPSPPTGTSDDQDDRDGPRSRVPFVIGAVAMLALLGTWIYVLFIYDPGLLIDELGDRTFPRAAEQVCAAAVAELDELPPAQQARSAADRAATVARSNEILDAMLDELEPLVPAKPERVHDGVLEWLDDWRSYLHDREEYADALLVDEEARFLESPKEGTNRQISSAIDAFAQVNRMDSCATPGDVS